MDGGLALSGRAFLLGLAVAFFGAVAVFGFLPRAVPPPAPLAAETSFDQQRAYDQIAALATLFPRRDDLSPERRQAQEWLAGRFVAIGLEPQILEFDEWIAGRRVRGLADVFAVVRGSAKPDEVLLVLAHYDIPPFVRQGAADDASGVGIVLELARVFALHRPARTVVFMASDSEEYGAMWGAFNFLRRAGYADRLRAVLSIDFVNMGALAGIKPRFMGIQRGYTPLWLRELALAAAGTEAKALDSTPVFEWIDRSVTVAPTEHGVFLRAGIPAVNLGSQPVDSAWQNTRYHTPQDTIGLLQPDSVGKVGRAAERLLRGLDAMPHLPRGGMRYLRLGRTYLPGLAVGLLQLLVFSPLFAAAAASIKAIKGRLAWPWVFSRILLWLIPGLLTLAAAIALPRLGLMTRYEMYPATQKDPALAHPQVIPSVLLLFVFIFGFLLARRLMARPLRAAAPPSGRKAALLICLSCYVLILWAAGGGYVGAVFLLLPALFWPMIPTSRSLGGRLIGSALVILSTAVFVVFLYLFGKLYAIGILPWYLLMASSFGLFTPAATAAFLAGAALHLTALSAAWRR